MRGGLQAELKQETGPLTIRILKTSNIIIIIWNLYQYRYPDVNSCTRSLSKCFNFGFQRSCIWSQWMKGTFWTKLYTGFAWGPLNQIGAKVHQRYLLFWKFERKESYLKTNALQHASPWCMRICTWDCLYKYNKINCL